MEAEKKQREIKFQAFNTEDKEMYSDEVAKNVLYKRAIGADVEKWIIRQYTGLTDKNGVEIYEGDILDFDEKEWGAKFDPEVITMDKIIGEWDLCGSFSDLKEWRQVIGNIYENPNLV